MDNSQIKILVVEDDEFLRDFYYELLQGEGYAVDTAADGEIAFQKIHAGGWTLVMLDIMLPKMDGVQILTKLKQVPAAIPNGPIVVLTNLGNDTVINQCFSMGASGYLIKSSMDPSQVLVQIKSYLQVK